ncbi:MAG: pre-rRNA-processing protein TSR3, partial [Planctomycetota bacterium]
DEGGCVVGVGLLGGSGGEMDTGEFLDVLILRDPKESKAKCSLTPLRGMDGVRFVEYNAQRQVQVGKRVLLHAEGPVMSPLDLEEAQDGLLLIDCSWRRVSKLMRTVEGETVARRLPPLKTAYPRKSRTFVDPEEGLASVEALVAALSLLGKPRPEFLDAYRWRERFFELNPGLFD